MKLAPLVCSLFVIAALLGCAAGNFRRGDAIVIEEISPSAGKLKVGDVVVLRGRYTLQSEPQARLMVSLTTYGSGGRTPVSPRSHMPVQAGSGTFELEYEIHDVGSLHISFYVFSGGGNFGRLDIGDVRS